MTKSTNSDSETADTPSTWSYESPWVQAWHCSVAEALGARAFKRYWPVGGSYWNARDTRDDAPAAASDSDDDDSDDDDDFGGAGVSTTGHVNPSRNYDLRGIIRDAQGYTKQHVNMWAAQLILTGITLAVGVGAEHARHATSMTVALSVLHAYACMIHRYNIILARRRLALNGADGETVSADTPSLTAYLTKRNSKGAVVTSLPCVGDDDDDEGNASSSEAASCLQLVDQSHSWPDVLEFRGWQLAVVPGTTTPATRRFKKLTYVGPPFERRERALAFRTHVLRSMRAQGDDPTSRFALMQCVYDNRLGEWFRTFRRRTSTPSTPPPPPPPIAAETMTTTTTTTTTVLCLHGNRQCRRTFERYCRPLQKWARRANVRLVFLDALYRCSSPGVLASLVVDVDDDDDDADADSKVVVAAKDDARQWWPRFLTLDDIGRVEWDDDMATQCAPALDAIAAAVHDTGATVLLGFSQGANAAITYMQQRRDTRIRRVVSCCGYAFATPPTTTPPVPVPVPVLNVVSDRDDVVPMTLAPTTAHFERVASPLVHDKGHRMITKSADAQRVVRFLHDDDTDTPPATT
jgi:predicted esterase